MALMSAAEGESDHSILLALRNLGLKHAIERMGICTVQHHALYVKIMQLAVRSKPGHHMLLFRQSNLC